MKKKTAALMAALILAVSLSACGNANKEVKTSSENKEENQEEESVVESETSGKCGNDAVWSCYNQRYRRCRRIPFHFLYKNKWFK